jgi:hypothetical protein
MRSEERRTSPRLEVIDQLHGQLVTLKVRQTLRELGAGGFSTEGPVQFPKGAPHFFRFTTAAGVQVVLAATVVHSRPAGDPQDSPSYITGFSFVKGAYAETEAKIEILLDAVLGSLEFDEDAPSPPAGWTRHAE